MQYDPYKILGITKQATEEEIKRARRKLCVKHHPDQGGDRHKFNLVNEAYEKITKGKNLLENKPRKPTLRHSTLFTFKIV